MGRLREFNPFRIRAVTRTELANKALGYFHAEMRENFPGRYNLTQVELVYSFEKLNPFFMDTFGKAVGYATDKSVGTPLSDTDLKKAMFHVADISGGNVPTEARHLQVFYDALTSSYDLANVSTWGRLAKETAIATATDVKNTALAVGGIGLAVYGVIGGVLLYNLAKGRK